MADIDASSIKEWIPIGTASSPLKHNVDGSRYTIKNIAWTVDLDKYPDAGLFGCVNGATIRRLTVGDDGSKVSFKGTPSGNVAVGGIVGRALGTTLEGVTNNVSLTLDGSFSVGNNVFVGGLAGRTDASCLLGGDTAAKGCTNNGDPLRQPRRHSGAVFVRQETGTGLGVLLQPDRRELHRQYRLRVCG